MSERPVGWQSVRRSERVPAFASSLWPERAEEWLTRYHAQFWQEWLGGCGFREFSKDITERDWGCDVDAGPVFGGFSPAANGFAIAGMRAMGRFDLAWPVAAQSLAAGWPLSGGRFALAGLLSDPIRAPYLGEAALLSHFTTQPAPGVKVREGRGRLPSIVFVGIGIWLLTIALVCFWAWRRHRRWSRPAHVAAVPVPRVQVITWGLLLAFALGCWLMSVPFVPIAGLAIALLLPIDAIGPRIGRRSSDQ